MPWARSNASPEGCAQSAYTAGESRGSVTATARRERGAQGRGSSPGRAVIRYSSRCPTTAATGRDIELALSVALADLPPARAVIEAGPALAVVEPPHGGPWPRGGRRQPPPGRADRPQPPQDRPSRPAGAELPLCTAEAFHRKTADHIPAVLRLALLPPAEAIAELTARIAAAGRDIEALCETHPETAAPRQVTAVGPHHRAHVRAHDRGSRPLPEEPGGRRLPRARAEAARLGEARTATRHQQERRPGLETAARAARALHPRSVRPRYRSAPLGWTARGRAGTGARGHGSAPPPPSRGGWRCCCSRCGRAARSSSRCATPQPGTPRCAQLPPHATTETGGSDDPEQQRSDGRLWDRRLRGLARGVFAAELLVPGAGEPEAGLKGRAGVRSYYEQAARLRRE